MKRKAKSTKALFTAALATTVVTGSLVAAVPSPTEAAVNFKDVKPSVHYYEPVLELAARGVVKGYDDGTYRPNQSVTRAQAAKILAHVLDLDTVNVKDPGFKDVKKGDAYYGPIAALAQAGYIKGYEDENGKTFKPNNNLKRSQMAKILTLGFGLEEGTLDAKRFSDVKPDDVYAGYVAALLDNEITTGTTATTFVPNGIVTRGQMATFVIRTETALKDHTPESPETPEVPEQPEKPDDKPEVPETPGTPETPGNPDKPVNPAPPVEKTGEQLLQDSIEAQLAKGNASTDAVSIVLSDKTFTVNIKKPTTTVNDFTTVAQPVFDAFKTNTTVDSVTVSIVMDGQTIEISQSGIDNSQSFDAILNKALEQVGVSGDTKLDILKGKTVSLGIKGEIDTKDFNSTYHFKF